MSMEKRYFTSDLSSLSQALVDLLVAGLELGDGGTDLGYSPHDLVARQARVNRGIYAAPFIAHLVEIGVTDAAEEDFDLYVVVGSITMLDRSRVERPRRTGSGVGFRFVHMPI